MTELIDKQASMRAICDGCFKSRAVDLELRCRGSCDAIDTLQQQPTIEAEPVRHGRWIFDEYTAKYGHPYKCSECKEESRDTYDYCHCCGARMDGDDAE